MLKASLISTTILIGHIFAS